MNPSITINNRVQAVKDMPYTDNMKSEQQETILILDFGSQYTQLIARRIREQNVYCEIHPYTLSLAQIEAIAPEGNHPQWWTGERLRNRVPEDSPQTF